MRSADRLLLLGVSLAAACRSAPATDRGDQVVAAVPACDSAPPPAVRRQQGPLTAADRDALIRDLQARRAAWNAREIRAYRIQVAVGCFCPWPHHAAVLEVRDGVPVALLDTTGQSAGPVREPWSLHTVEGMFDAIERAAKSHDVVEVSYDACLGYPTRIRGDAKVGQFDDWYTVTAGRLTPR